VLPEEALQSRKGGRGGKLGSLGKLAEAVEPEEHVLDEPRAGVPIGKPERTDSGQDAGRHQAKFTVVEEGGLARGEARELGAEAVDEGVGS
jgi:hypothetical protein